MRMSRQLLNQLEKKGKIIFLVALLSFLVVNTHSPLGHQTCRNKFIAFILDHLTPHFFGNT